jgi:hypothetical protein
VKSYKVATKLQGSPIDQGKPEYDIEVNVDEDSVPISNDAEAVKRHFTFPVLNVPRGFYFAKIEIDGEIYMWDIRVGVDPSAPTRLETHEIRYPQHTGLD